MVKKNVICFVGGKLQALDLDEKGVPVSGGLSPGEALAAADALHGPTKQELIKALKEKGIPFKVTMTSAELSALLEKGPETNGTGNQEVI